jgi:hypothetical protein
MLQLVVDAPGILLGYQVIAGLNVGDLLVDHVFYVVRNYLRPLLVYSREASCITFLSGT